MTTNQQNENSMQVRITCREVIITQTASVTVPDSSVMANPEQNAATTSRGTVSPTAATGINISALP